MMTAIVLTDGKAGHENQSKAFVRALGLDARLVPVGFRSPVHKALSYLLDRLGIRTTALVDFAGEPGGAKLVIGTGSGTFYAAKALARRLGARCGVVLYPRGYDLPSFDCILAPSFDRPARLANVVGIPANLVANDAAFYDSGVKAFRERYKGPVENLVGVIIGGPNKCSAMPVEWAKARLDGIFAANRGSQLCVTTSRRTPPEVEALVDTYPWAYKLIYSRDRFNPIPAFVQLAKTAEVVALDNLKPGRHKFRRFVEDLRAAGYVDGSRKIDLSAEFAAARSLMGL